MLTAEQITIDIGKKRICADLSVELHGGKIWGILGPNGCGKTTLLRALAGQQRLTAGRIMLGAEPLTTLPQKLIAQQLGILFQDFNPTFPQTIWDYCLGGRFPHSSYFTNNSQHDQRIAQQALRKLELDNNAQRLITTLSGGEQRRLAIATLLTQAPRVYLLDEPANHLDLRHQHQVLAHFRELAEKENAAVMMALHDVNQAYEFCDYVMLVFPEGAILQGEARELLTAENLSRLYRCAISMQNVWGFRQRA